MERIEMQDEIRPLYMQVDTTRPSFRSVSVKEQWDFDVKLWLPESGDGRVVAKLIEEYDHYLSNWGYNLLGVPWAVHNCGHGRVVRLTFQIQDPSRESATEEDPRPNATQLGVLREITQVRHTVAGEADIEEVILDDVHIATRVTLTATEGEFGRIDRQALQDEDINLKQADANQYTFFVPSVTNDTDDEAYYPAQTASWVANQIGLFLIEQTKEPERTIVTRNPSVVEVDV